MSQKINLASISIVMFDLDGTVYYGNRIISGANDAIGYFRELGKKIYFTTNNSFLTKKQVYQKLINLGVQCHIEEVLTSGYMAAQYCSLYGINDVFVFGSENLINEFHDHGVRVNQTDKAENLVIGYNPDFTYGQLTKAVRVAINANNIIACNKERVYPGKDAELYPGCGAMTAPVEWCSRKECNIIIGKPNTAFVDIISALDKTPASSILMIGDTYESDIIMANKAGCQSILISNKCFEDTVNIDSIGNIRKVFGDL